MNFKVVGKSLILTDYSHKITEGENSFDTVRITAPRNYDDCDLSMLSFRFSEISEDGKNSAVQVLCQEKCDEKYLYLKGSITTAFSAIIGKVTFMLTGINGENVVAKFQSSTFIVNDDIGLDSLPNDMTAEQLFNQTQFEVQKAIDAAKQAKKYSETPAPAEIFPATTEILGGVKVDGKTITVSGDGTISSPDSESLKSDIKNTTALAVQIAHPNNFLIYDNLGKPSVMVAIPKFYLDEVIDGASHTVHPAFIINGIEQEVIYISKYQNIVENGRAYSLPMKKPQTNVTFDQAYDYCKAKGAGWHLMTNAEWAAIALWCKKNGTMPKGNNDYGKDISEINLPRKAIPASYDSNGQITIVLTGSGSERWYHDGTYAGIADMNGNINEFTGGLRLINGEIQIIKDNNAAVNNTMWKAIALDGTLVEPGTDGTIHFSNGYGIKFSNISTSPDSVESCDSLLESLCLIPHKNDSDYGDDLFWMEPIGNCVAFRGGSFSNKNSSGIFLLNLSNDMSYKYNGLGFRCAYYDPN